MTILEVVSLNRKDETLRLLAGASDLLAECLDYEATLEMVANLLVSSLAKWCVIDLVTADGKIERVAVAHRDPAKADMARKMLLHYPAKPDATQGVYRVIETRESVLAPICTKDTWAHRADDPEHLRMILELGSTSYMCVPLIARGRVVGSIMLFSAERTYDDGDVQTAEALARCIAMAVDNVSMFRKKQEAIRIRDEFLAILSHELRTPLNVIQGWVEILKSEKLDEASFQQALDMLDRNSQLQARLINDLLDVSRIRSGKLSMEMQTVDLTAVLASTAESIRLSAEKKNIVLHTQIALEARMISGDFSHLQRMVLNLLSNAIKFTPSGGRVELIFKVIENDGVIVVRDTGKGIDPQFIPYVFESFKQEDSATTRLHGGLGLGLAITKHIVERHGGRIAVTSEGKGKGAEITIHLPLLQETKPQEYHSSPVIAEKPGELVLKGVRVLLVDDAADMRFLLARYLQRSGAEVVVVSSAAQAFEELKKMKPDILLSDIGMPEEDGYSLIARIRSLPEEQGGKTLAIALTAYTRDEEKQRALAAGFDSHLTKPIFCDVLIEKIRRLLQLFKKV
jgi:signal transduction histidine kinase